MFVKCFKFITNCKLLFVCMLNGYIEVYVLSDFLFVFFSLQLCNSEEFWEQTVRKHCDTVTPTVEALAKEVGWRTIFFTNKLQLQMQISRRKQKENQPCEDKNEPSSSSVPLE